MKHGGGEHSLKISAPLFERFRIYDVLKIGMSEGNNKSLKANGVCRTAPDLLNIDGIESNSRCSTSADMKKPASTQAVLGGH